MATTNASDGQISSAAQARDGVNGRNRAEVVSPPVPDTRARMQRSVVDGEAMDRGTGELRPRASGRPARDPRPAREGMTARTPLVRTDDFDAVLFDLDGVLTTTRVVHAAAWKRTSTSSSPTGTPGTIRAANPSTTTPTTPPTSMARRARTACGTSSSLGGSSCPTANRTTRPSGRRCGDWATASSCSSRRSCERAGVEVFPGSVAWVRELREAGLKTAVVSSSRNCAAVLDTPGSPTCSTRASTAIPRSSWTCRQAGARHVPGGAPSDSASPRPGDGGRGRAGRGGGRPGGSLRAGHRGRPGWPGRRAGRSRRRPRGRRSERTAGRAADEAAIAQGLASTGWSPRPPDPRCGDDPADAWRLVEGPTTPTTSSRPRRCSRSPTASSGSGRLRGG